MYRMTPRDQQSDLQEYRLELLRQEITPGAYKSFKEVGGAKLITKAKVCHFHQAGWPRLHQKDILQLEVPVADILAV